MKPVGLIAIMGGTGSGKSTFINTIIGKDITDVGHGLESQTTEAKEYEFSMPNGVRVTLVDTPGFNDYTDDGGKSDLVILKEIGAYLKAKYDDKRKFSGILYLHNISDPKVGGSSQRNVVMFKKLCGPDPLKNVVVVTTFWDEVDLMQGVENESELKTKDKFFKELVDGKCRFARSGKYSPGKTPEGPEFPPPISIVSDLLALNPVFVEMQKELAEGKTVEKTSAGVELQVVYKELQELKRQQKKDNTDWNQKLAEMESREATRDNIRRIELQHVELELLKTQHAKEILECQYQIRSLLDGNSHDAYQRSQLEKTCEDLTATVYDLSQSLSRLRATNEKDALARTELAQRHGKTLSDLAEAKSKIAHLELQLKISQEAQEKMASDHTSSSTPSSDGKGGTDSAAKGRKSTKRMGPCYVYYRLYTKLGAFESIRPLYNNDHFIGRIPTKSFAPPHTVASIRRSLCKHECLSEPDKALVFTPLSSPAPKESSARLALHAPSGPGLSKQDPIALVVESEKRTSKDVTQQEKLPERSEDTDIHYVYYRICSSGGEDEKAKTSFDESDISLGRIDTLSIAPPHTAGSLKAHIAKVECLVTPGHALYKDMELFGDMNGDAAMSDTDVISFQSDAYPGSDQGDPVALVNATTNTATDQKAKPTPGAPDSKSTKHAPLPPSCTVYEGDHVALVNATTNTAADQKTKPTPDSNFTKRARVTCTRDYGAVDPTWLSIKKDEIVHTDGVIVSGRYISSGPSWSGYMVINSKGEKGFVIKDDIAFKLIGW